MGTELKLEGEVEFSPTQTVLAQCNVYSCSQGRDVANNHITMGHPKSLGTL